MSVAGEGAEMKTAAEIAMEKALLIPNDPEPVVDSNRKCTNCQWCKMEDEGYSEWTVTGYSASCMFGLVEFNSEVESTHDRLNLTAVNCPHFTDGYPLHQSLSGEVENTQEITDWIRIVCK